MLSLSAALFNVGFLLLQSNLGLCAVSDLSWRSMNSGDELKTSLKQHFIFDPIKTKPKPQN